MPSSALRQYALANPHHLGPCRRAFTLVEILIVVVILGILAAIIIPSFTNASEDTKQTAFIASVKNFSNAAMVFRAMTGQHLEDAGSGIIPAGFDEYIRQDDWENGTPIGGVWDAELNSFGLTSALGVHFDGTGDTQDATFMTHIDQQFDDGDLATGAFRQLAADRYYYVLAE